MKTHKANHNDGKPRLLHTRTGIRVLNSNRCEPIVLPPTPRLTAEEIWTGRVELYRQMYEAAKVVCPPGARLIPLGMCLKSNVTPFAIVDEDDFERISKHRWQARVRNGKTRAVAHIDGSSCQMSRFVMGVSHRYVSVIHLGESLDNRKSKLMVDRSRVGYRTSRKNMACTTFRA